MRSANFNIRAGSKLHQTIVSEICKRQKHSQNKMSKRYEKWREMDDTQVAYVKEREVDTIRRAAKKTGGLAITMQRFMSQWAGMPPYSSGPAAESRALSNYEVVEEMAWRPTGALGFLPNLSNNEKTLALGALLAAGAWWYFKIRKK